MNKIIGFLVVFQLVLATVAFGAESDSDCTDGVQAARGAGEGNSSNAAPVPVQPDSAPVLPR